MNRKHELELRNSRKEEKLFSDFSQSGSEGENSDQENMKTEITFQRSGYSKQMFTDAAIGEMLKYTTAGVKKLIKKYGAFRVKPNDTIFLSGKLVVKPAMQNSETKEV